MALNGALSLCVLAILAAASFWAPALLLLLLLGPLAAAMMHCAVLLVRDGELSLRSAALVAGIREVGAALTSRGIYP